MDDDYLHGVHGVPQQEKAMVPGAPTEAPTRKVEVEMEMTRDFQSLNIEPFRDNHSIPTSRSLVEEAQPRAPQAQTQPPQRSESSSSAESDEQLQAALQTARSDSERVAIYKTYGKEQRRKNRKLEQMLTEQLKSAEDEHTKLLQLLDDAQKERTASESSLESQVETLKNKVLVLQTVLKYERCGEAIPDNIHLQLVEYELNEVDEKLPLSSDQVSTCPFSALNNHDFFHLLVTNMIQTRGTHCLGCTKKVVRVDSHPYSKGILIAAAARALGITKEAVEDMPLFWRNDLSIVKRGNDPNFHKHATIAKTCTYPVKREAFCGKCDNSSSYLEQAFSEQFGKPNIRFRQDDITEVILLIQMFRGSILSIDIQHYVGCQPCGKYLSEVGETMLELMHLHQAVCEKKPFSDVAEQCERLKPAVFYKTDMDVGHRILFPMVVNTESLGLILYAQIPPYFWAVPCTVRARKRPEVDLSEIVRLIDTECSKQEEDFFGDVNNVDAKEWKDTVHKPLLVFPLLKCCINIEF